MTPLLHAALDQEATFSTPQDPALSPGLQQQIRDAGSLAEKWKDAYISSDHFFHIFWQSSVEPFASWRKKTGIRGNLQNSSTSKNR